MKKQKELIETLRECQEKIKILADDFEKEEILSKANSKPLSVLEVLMRDLGIDISKWSPETIKFIDEKYSVKLKLNLK